MKTRITWSETKRYLYRVGQALSIFVNVILGGPPNQMFSARNWHWKREGKPNIVHIIDYLLGEHHCAESWVYWRVRKDIMHEHYLLQSAAIDSIIISDDEVRRKYDCPGYQGHLD